MDPATQNPLVHPDREASSTLPALEDLFRAAARDVRTRLVNRAGADIPVRLGVAQVTTVGRIVQDTDARDGGVFGLFRFNPLGLPGLLVVQGRLLARLVGVLLGEDPELEPPPYRVRPVTSVESRFCQRVCEDVLASLAGAWPKSPRPQLDIESLGPNHPVAVHLTRRLLNECFATSYEDAIGHFLAAQHRAMQLPYRAPCAGGVLIPNRAGSCRRAVPPVV